MHRLSCSRWNHNGTRNTGATDVMKVLGNIIAFVVAIAALTTQSAAQAARIHGRVHTPVRRSFGINPDAHTIATYVSDNCTIKTNCSCWNDLGSLEECSREGCEALFHSQMQTSIEVGPATINVAPGATIFLCREGKKIVVSNLHDSHIDDVVVRCGDQRLDLPVGFVVSLDSEAPQSSLCASAFNWVSTLKSSELLKHLRKSSDLIDSSMWSRTIKTAAAVTKIHGSSDLEYISRNAETYNKGTLKVR